MNKLYKITERFIQRDYSKLFLMVILFVTGTINLNAQTTITIGAGSQSGTQSNGAAGDCGPMYRSTNASNFVYSRHHYLYTAAELAAAGITAGNNITQLAWNNQNGAGTNSPCIFQIWIKNSSLTDVGAAGQNWATLITGSTQVYNSSSHNVPAVVGWHQVPLSTTFLYTGGALEISVNFDISAGTNPWTTAGFSWFKDPITGRTLSYVGSTPAGATLPNLRTVRAQMQITYVGSGACTNPPTAGTATATPPGPVCSGASIALNLSGNTTGTGQTYQWESGPSAGGPWSPIGGVQSSPLLNINPGSTLFYHCVVTCGVSSTSSSVQLIVTPGLSGAYTINSALATGGTNFQTFTAAIAALSCGITGPVIFNVVSSSGPYTEQISIPVVGGASSTNTITFNGNGNTLQFSSSNSAARHIIQLNGADYITFNNLVINGAGGTYAWGFHFINAADNNTISNCTVNVSTTDITTTNHHCIVMSNSATSVTTTGNNGNNNTITGCLLKGGYYTVVFYGNSTAGLQNTNNTLSNNIIQDSYSYTTYLAYQSGVNISGNNYSRPTRTASTTTAAVFDNR